MSTAIESCSFEPHNICMFRFTILPIILIFATLFLSIVVYVFIKKVKKGVSTTLQYSKKLANEQREKWSKKEQRNKLPTILQNGLEQFDEIKKSHQTLPNAWLNSLNPIIEQAQAILDELTIDAAHDLEESNKNIKSKTNKIETKINSIRSFFNHSLDALLQFVIKLNSDHATMAYDEIEKAQQNITIFKSDLLAHQATLKKARKMDFDVLMDVIKARLRK